MNIFDRVIRYTQKVTFLITSRDPITGLKVLKKGNKKRFGDPLADWVIPGNILNEKSICYLAGAGENISFDISIANTYKSDVNIFDPTPKSIAYFKKLKQNSIEYQDSKSIEFLNKNTLNHIRFHEFGVWKDDSILKFYAPENPNHVSHSLVNLQGTSTFFEAKVLTLRSIMKMLGHQHIDLLKIDIEGAEYEVINSMLTDKIFPKVVCIEYDEVFNPIDKLYTDRVRTSLESLLSVGYTLFHIEFPGNYTLIK